MKFVLKKKKKQTWSQWKQEQPLELEESWGSARRVSPGCVPGRLGQGEVLAIYKLPLETGVLQ